MFCPTCGKDNTLDLKFCASCGTDLAAVSQALTGREEDFFTRMDAGMDFFIARYSEHVFKNAPQSANERKVGRSWQILGQAVLTSFIDILLFFLMWNLLPLRLIVLAISTPFRLVAERNGADESDAQAQVGYKAPQLLATLPGTWIAKRGTSVTESTTKNLDGTGSSDPSAGVTTGHLK
jgi:hypothetical protein